MKRVIIIAGTTLVVAVGGGAAAVAYADSPSPSPSTAAPSPTFPPRTSMNIPDLGSLLYGEESLQSSAGITLHDWQKGSVTAVSGSALTVKSGDGTSWTWTVDGTTKVGALGPFAADDSATSLSKIKAGDTVLVAGTRSGSTRTAKQVADPPPDFGKIKQRLGDLRKKIADDLRNGLPKGLPTP